MVGRSHIGGFYSILDRRDVYRLNEIIDQCADVGGGGIHLLTDTFTEKYDGNIEAMPPKELVEWLEYPFKEKKKDPRYKDFPSDMMAPTVSEWIREVQKSYAQNQEYGSGYLTEVYRCVQDLQRIKNKARVNYNRWYI